MDDLGPIQGLDHIEKLSRTPDLVGLKGPDQVPLQATEVDGGNLFFGFLNAVFPKQCLSPLVGLFDAICREGLRNRQKANFRWIAAATQGDGFDFPAQPLKIGGDINHER